VWRHAGIYQVSHIDAGLVQQPLHGRDGQPVDEVLPMDEPVEALLAAAYGFDPPSAVGGL
jgi:hypothetical protein